MNNVEKLVEVVNNCLEPMYVMDVVDIPEKYINVDMNHTKSTQCVEIRKVDDDTAVYVDWYYNEFNEETLRNECENMTHIDRDMDASLAYEFRDIGFKIINALNELS